MSSPVISIVVAIIRDDAGRVLVVRKRGTAAFMQHHVPLARVA